MSFNGTFYSIVEEKGDENLYWKLNYKLENHIWILQRNYQILVSLIAFAVFNDSSREENLNELPNKIWEERRILTKKQEELGHPSTSYAFLNQHVSPSVSHLYYSRQMCYQANPGYSKFFSTKLHLDGLETVLLIYLKRNQRSLFHMWPLRPPLWQSKLFHYGLPYHHLLYNIFN